MLDHALDLLDLVSWVSSNGDSPYPGLKARMCSIWLSYFHPCQVPINPELEFWTYHI